MTTQTPLPHPFAKACQIAAAIADEHEQTYGNEGMMWRTPLRGLLAVTTLHKVLDLIGHMSIADACDALVALIADDQPSGALEDAVGDFVTSLPKTAEDLAAQGRLLLALAEVEYDLGRRMVLADDQSYELTRAVAMAVATPAQFVGQYATLSDWADAYLPVIASGEMAKDDGHVVA